MPLEHTGPISQQITPPQGCTSQVILLEAERGHFALKTSTVQPYIDWLASEATVLRALQACALPIPRPVYFERNGQAASLLMTLLPGEPLSTLLARGVSVSQRHDLLYQFGALLKQIHATPCPATLRHEQPWLDRIREEAEIAVSHGYAEPNAPDPALLFSQRPSALSEVLIHGDYTIDNVLVENGQLTGVIDWGRGTLGDRRYDLVLATRPLELESAFLDEGDFNAFYAGYGGDRLSEEEEEWFLSLYEYF